MFHAIAKPTLLPAEIILLSDKSPDTTQKPSALNFLNFDLHPVSLRRVPQLRDDVAIPSNCQNLPVTPFYLPKPLHVKQKRKAPSKLYPRQNKQNNYYLPVT